MAATNGATPNFPVICWEFQFPPNAQKTRNYFHAIGVKYKHCELPFFLPRQILLDLGITYRRVPIVSYGKDVFLDTHGIIETGQELFADKALPVSPVDPAFESYGYRLFFTALRLIPAAANTPELGKDRGELFPVLLRPDFKDLRPSALAELRLHFDEIENQFLGHGKPWIAGDRCGIADINAIWVVKWLLQTMGVGNEAGFDKASYPRIYRWVEGLPPHDENNKGEPIPSEEATELVLKSNYTLPDIGVDPADPTGYQKGDLVSVETTDDGTPGNNPQRGKLVGLGRKEIVLELPNTLRLHFPRIGYILKKL